MKTLKRFAAIALLALLLCGASACTVLEGLQTLPDLESLIPDLSQLLSELPSEWDSVSPDEPIDSASASSGQETPTPDFPTPSPDTPDDPEIEKPDEDGSYYDLENVVKYLNAYGKLPGNYITKKEAEALGWSGGSVESVKKGGAIGGDYFGNMEGLLPKEKGRKYTECDLDTLGAKNRGAKRLVFSNDGLYFYTDDHYESFRQVIVNGRGEVVFA